MRPLWPLGLLLGLAVSQDDAPALTTPAEVCTATSTAHHKKVVCTPYVKAPDTKDVKWGCLTEYSTASGCGVSRGSSTTSVSVSTNTIECNPTACPGCKLAAEKRDEALEKRVLPVPGLHPYNSFDEFMVGEVARAERQGNLVPHRQMPSHAYAYVPDWFGNYRWEPKRDYNVQASSARARHFRDQQLNMAVKGLVGCTSVILVSRKGVWMSHLWEGPSFEHHERFNGIDVMTGIYNSQDPEFSGLLHYGFNGEMFDPISYTDGMENKVQIIIQTPRRQEYIPKGEWPAGAVGVTYTPDENPGVIPPPRGPYSEFIFDNDMNAPRYQHQIEKLRRVLQESWSTTDPIKINVYPLVEPPAEVDDIVAYRNHLSETTAMGKVLVQYDPFFRCNPQRAGIRVWVDGMTDPIYTDSWIPFEHQKPRLGPNANMQQVFLANRDLWNSTEEVCIMSNTTTSRSSKSSTTSKPSSTSKPASTTLPAITSCSPLAGGVPGNPKQTQCACNDHLVAILSSSTKIDGSTAFWCGAGSATVSVKAPAPTPTITSCKPEATGVPGPPDTTLCKCNGDQTLTASSTSGKDGATTVFCGNSRTTLPATTIPAAAGASAIAGILGGLKPEPSKTTSKSSSTSWIVTNLETRYLEPSPEPEPEVDTVWVTTTLKPPTPTKAFVGGICAIHVTRKIKKKQWPRGPDITIAYRVYDHSGKMLHQNEKSGQFDTHFFIEKQDTKLDHAIEIRYDEEDEHTQACKLIKEQTPIWDIQCAYQKFQYGDKKWRLPDVKWEEFEPLDVITDPLRVGDHIPSAMHHPDPPYCKVGRWDEDPNPHTQDMDCFFKC